jgi:protein-L-isoaspartate(D-aspartate) O-methyltransferase
MASRKDMIRDIKDKYGLDAPEVFETMLQVPRERFISKEYRDLAYHDRPIPIGHGQTISQPYTVAFMTDLLDLQGEEKVLEIGTGSGYQAAILSKLAKEVFSVERVEELAKRAEKNLQKLGFKNIHIRHVKDEIGWEDEAPFDVVLVTASLDNGVSTKLIKQLKPGGVMVAPVGEEMIKFVKRKNGQVKKESHGPFRFVPFVEG